MKGFVDVQVNGFLGIGFDSPGLTVDQVRRVTKELLARGTLAYCPTVISSSLDAYERVLPVLAGAMDERDLAPHLLGVHLEGPFLQPAARGAHAEQHLRAPSPALFDRLQDLAAGKVALVTVAPELPGCEELIRHVRAGGVAVSIGHHTAARDAIARAAAAGASASTHLGNGIPNLLPRHPNPLWDQLDEDRLAAMLIVDGHHLPDAFVRVALRVKGVARLVAVSDAAPLAGCPPGRYETMGQQVVLEPGGRLWNPEGQHLVGSTATLLECMNRLARVTALSEAELWAIGHHNPLALIGRRLEAAALERLPDVVFEDRAFRAPI